MQKSYIPYLYNTDTSVKQTLGSVPLVSVLKRFDCIAVLITIRFVFCTKLNPKLQNVNATATLGTEESSHCKDVSNENQCMDCPPKKVVVVERWPLVEVRL